MFNIKKVLSIVAGLFIVLVLFLWAAGGQEFNVSADKASQALEEIEEKVENKVLPKPDPMADPPEVVNAIYLTSWSAASDRVMGNVLELARDTEINAVVIDIKDFSGFVSFDTEVESVEKYNAEKHIINLPSLVRKLHNNQIYVIARIAVFQDPLLAEKRPDLAVMSSSTGEIWRDRKGLAWVDPASEEVWDYIVDIAKDVSNNGVDEVNFDYVRFPTDGNLKDMKYPVWNEQGPMHRTIKSFFAYLDDNLDETTISADLFGLTTVNRNGLGIGQIIEHAYEHFDFVAPMVYPSHYAEGALGFEDPASEPYGIVYDSMKTAYDRLIQHRSERVREIEESKNNSSSTPKEVSIDNLEEMEIEIKNENTTSTKIINSKLRPWLQDFSLRVDYDAGKVAAQIEATKDALGQDYVGYMLWDPANIYTKEALVPGFEYKTTTSSTR